MIGSLISLVVYLVIVGVLYWAVTEILKVVPMPAPIANVIRVIMIVILVLIVVYALLGLVGGVPRGVWLR